MMRIIANQFTLTEFLLDNLPPAQRADVLLYPKRIKGVTYSLLKAVDAWCPFPLPGYRPFPQAHLQALAAIPPDAPVLIFGIENIKDLCSQRVAVFTRNPVIDYQQNHKVRRLHIQQLKGLGLHVYTFDPGDAQQYGLTLTRQVYRRVDAFRKALPEQWDIYFLGKDKNRFATLRALGEQWQGFALRLRLLPVYSPARFFILEQDDPATIAAFLAAPLPALPPGALDSYDFSHWLQQFETLSAA